MSTCQQPSPDDAITLLRESGRLLFANGHTTKRVVEGLQQLGESLGTAVTVIPEWSGLEIRLSGPDAQERVVAEAIPAGVEMNKVTRTLAIMDAVCLRTCAPAQAIEELRAVDRLPPVTLARFAALAGAGAAALAVIFGATGLVTLLMVFASATAGACARRLVARHSRNPLYQPLCAALLAGLFAAGASHLLPSSAIFMIALCPCMILVPGPHFLNGAIDLARFRLPLGAARLGYAGLVVLIISIGLVVGLSVGRASLPLTGGAAVPLAFDVFAAGVAVAAYGTFFSMPWRMLPFPVIVGMAGHALNWSVLAAGAERPTAALAACLFVGAVVTPVANRLRLPFAAVAFASVVSMIPGSFLFRMADDLFRLMQADAAAQATLLTSAVVNATTAVSVLLAMGLGLIIPKIVIEAFDSPGRP